MIDIARKQPVPLHNTFLKRDVPDSTSFWNSNAAIVTSWA